MLKIGLTGGIGSGKSTVCQLFAELGVPIIDADVIARQLVEPGLPALQRIVDLFGEEMLNGDGSLNRAKLRESVFSAADKKRQLDGLMHPLVYAQIAAEVAALRCEYCVIAVPLLLESTHDYAFDRILLIDCPEALQIERVMQRNGFSLAQVQAIIDSQMPRQQRFSRVDDVVSNVSDLAQLAEQIKSLHNSYILLASARIRPA